MPTLQESLGKLAREAVLRLFTRQAVHFGLTTTPKGDRRLTVQADPRFTLGAMYEKAVRAGGALPRSGTAATLRRVALGYLTSQREAVVAAATRAVQGAVLGADLASRHVPDQVRKDVVAALAGVLERVRPAIERIISSETVAARNLGGVEAIVQTSAAAGVKDPLLYFVIVRDGKCCSDCRAVHLLDDGVTPRVFKLSEVNGGYAKRGDGRASLLGRHPLCRCHPTSLLPGWGFDAGGGVRFVSLDHDELARQRG